MAAQTQTTDKMPEVKPVKRLPMVGWYDPRQLAKTGIEVAVSTIFGRHSDHRLVEAMAAGDHEDDFFDYTYYYHDDGKETYGPDPTKPRNSIWIDYVGDVGDGWNSTYAVAYHLSQPEGEFTYTDQKTGKQHTEKTERGAVMIFGGDEVYPTASREEYDQRLVAPYETALKDSGKDCPHVFAIPGNHDWYDSLVAFTRLFTARPWFAGWRTRQTRSYFALRLPHNWWLLGTDLQLGSDIDKPQMDYFEKLAATMDKESQKTGQNARIIVCHAEPHWIRAAQYGGEDPNYNESNLKLLEKRLGCSIAVFIAGDLHHYRRHESADKTTQKITAGGGGAFLHPTHVGRRGKSMDTLVEKGLRENEERKFKLEGCFPSTDDSRRLCWRNLFFPYLKGNGSRTFGLMTAVLYLLLTLPIVLNAELLKDDAKFNQITHSAILGIFGSPLSVFLIFALIAGFIFFTDTHSKTYRIIMGGLHAVAHILAAFFIAIGAVLLTGYLTTGDWIRQIPWFGDLSFPVDTRIPLLVLLVLVGGFVLGSFIMGAYLLISLNFFGRHGNEAFSSLSIEDWKNFIRLHINEQGDLTIYPIGIRKVPRKWKQTNGASPSKLEPDPPNDPAHKPELIELPVVMKKAATETGVYTADAPPATSSPS
jgi:Calcineurin-like phosphoesterase